MGRPKNPTAKFYKVKCPNCGKEKKIYTDGTKAGNEFYENPTTATGFDPVCKQCVVNMVKGDDLSDIDSLRNRLKSYLQTSNKYFNEDIYIRCFNKATENYNNHKGWKNVLFIYNKDISSLPQYKGLTWSDSVHDGTDVQDVSDVETTKFKKNNKNIHNKIINDDYDLESLKEKYGYGYPENEYTLFEKKYQQLKPSFQLLTTMHDECLREYCVDKVKETLAKAKGNFKEAKDWAAMAKDAATSGKLNPSQMSKADLSGGLDTFGQLSRMVEQTPQGELLKLLPKFTERPKDKVDIVLWHYVNYVRDLKGLPEVEYKEIYKFYEQRNKDYEKQMLDLELTQEEDVIDNGEL